MQSKTILVLMALILQSQAALSNQLLAGFAQRAHQSIRRLQTTETDDPTSIDQICSVIEGSFEKDVTCKCVGNNANSFSINCEHENILCSENSSGRVCGKPQLAVSLINSEVFSATTCLKNQSHGMLPMLDTCVFVDACEDKSGFCGCTASYGGHVCEKCEICDDGHGISIDCSKVNWEAVTTECAAVDLDLHLGSGAGHIVGFAPQFEGFCSQIEQALDNTIQCDCTEASGGTFQLTCETTEELCYNSNCGHVKSTVEVKEGEINSINSCATHQAPQGETCTKLVMCDGDRICGCHARYNDEMCASCEVCEGGIQLDCSNVHPEAHIDKCQPVDRANAYEFLPDYSVSSNLMDRPATGNSGALGASLAAFVLLAVSLFL